MARIITAVLVLLAILAGGYTSLNSLKSKTELVFINGQNNDGLGIENDLGERIDLAYNLVTIAKKHLDEQDQLIINVLLARDALITAKSPAQKYNANMLLTQATTDLYNKLGAINLPEKDESYRKSIYADLSSRNDTISHDGYNAAAQQFNDLLLSFPASIIANLTGIKPVELFR